VRAGSAVRRACDGALPKLSEVAPAKRSCPSLDARTRMLDEPNTPKRLGTAMLKKLLQGIADAFMGVGDTVALERHDGFFCRRCV